MTVKELKEELEFYDDEHHRRSDTLPASVIDYTQDKKIITI